MKKAVSVVDRNWRFCTSTDMQLTWDYSLNLDWRPRNIDCQLTAWANEEKDSMVYSVGSGNGGQHPSHDGQIFMRLLKKKESHLCGRMEQF